MTLTVGQRLHIARENQGLTLQDVSHQTRIPVPRLRDLEDDTYTTFGSLTYARTFLKDYSKVLGVDAHEVLDEMHAPPLGGTDSYKYLVQNYGTWTRKRAFAGPTSYNSSGPSMIPRSRSMGVMAAASVGIFILGVGMLLGSTWSAHKAVPAAVPVTEEIRAASLAPQPGTQVAPFSAASQEMTAPTPSVALTVGNDTAAKEDKAPPAKKLELAPGEIPKALPVVEPPKGGKTQRP